MTYLLGAMVPILLSREPSARGARAHGAHRARARRPGQLPRGSSQRAPASRLLDGYGSTETNFVIGAPRPSATARARWAACVDGFEARVVDEDDDELPDGEAGELVLRADEPFAFAHRLFRHAREDRRGLAQLLVPHRRPRGARDRRLVPFPRPAEGRDPPARREHLLVRGRAGAAQPSGGRQRPRSFPCARSSPRTR